MAFVAIWIATRSLGPAGYGGVVAVLAASQLLGNLAVNWTTVSVARFGCEEFIKTGRVASTFWTRLLVLAPNLILVCAVSPWLLPPITSWLHLPPGANLLVLSHLVAATCWAHVQQTLLAAKLPRLQGWLLTLERAYLVLALGGLAVSGTASWPGVALSYITAAVLASSVGLWRLRYLLLPLASLDRPLLRRILTFSYPLVPYAVIGFFYTNYLDTFFIARLLSTEKIGIYAVAYQLAGTAMQLPLLAGSLLLPSFVTLQVHGRDKQMAGFLQEILPVLTLLWAAGCAILAGIASYTLPLVFSHWFQASVELVWPLMAAAALAGPIMMGYGAVSNAKSATYMSAVSVTASAGVNLALNALLIPRFGLIGCAWATVGAYAANLMVLSSLVHHRLSARGAWARQAALPMVAGAAYMTWRSDNLGALFATLFAAGLMALLYRRAVAAGLRTLETAGVLRSARRLWLRREEAGRRC